MSINALTEDAAATPATLTVGSLIHAYRTEPISRYHGLRHHTRRRHDILLRKVVRRHGDVPLPDLRAKTVQEWYLDWSGNKTKLSSGHSFIQQLRALVRFGVLNFEDPDCVRLTSVLSALRYPSSARKKKVRLTFEHADAICRMAHKFALPSIAFAQALQFECGFRQKDAIGEIVPIGEPGIGLPWRDKKWMRGVIWPEIDRNLILRHVTSKKLKPVVFDLKTRPLVMRELNYLAHISPGKKWGAIVKCETTGLPWSDGEFRRKWRMIANAAGVPSNVCNNFSRRGFVSEAIEAGVPIETVRTLATHSHVQQTEEYFCGEFEEADAVVMQARIARRAARIQEAA